MINFKKSKKMLLIIFIDSIFIELYLKNDLKPLEIVFISKYLYYFSFHSSQQYEIYSNI